MTFEETLDELKTLKDVRPEICEKIKRHNLPVIIYGAGVMSRQITKVLKFYGIEIFGYVVDEKYYKPNQIYIERPIYNFAEISADPKKYVFVLGINDESITSNFIEEFLHNTKIISYAFTYSFNLETPFNYEYIFSNREKFAETFSLLEDNLSKKTLIDFLKLRITHDINYSFETYRPYPYFNELTNGVRTPNNGGGYVDCGAFRGDTIENFINWSGGNYEKIFAVEPDSVNFSELKKFIDAKNYKNIVLVNCGVWNEKNTLTFSETNDMGSSVSENGKIKISADTIDNITGGEKINFIKMDIEGAELSALQGAAENIKKFKPTLAICAYHKSEDLITLPQFIKNLNPDYKIYLRKHSHSADSEIIVYAI